MSYELFTSIMANITARRFFLPTLINNDQTGFKRQTQDNIRKTLHIMDHIQTNKIKAMVISVEAEKAFDSVNWIFV